MKQTTDLTELLFCRELCGIPEVSERHARSVVNRARDRFDPESVETVLTLFASGGLDTVMDDPGASGIARSIAYCLYTGLLPDVEGQMVQKGVKDRDPVLVEEDYFESVVWRAIQAHPRALTGGYFGHWHYPPEDVHGDD